MPGPWEDGLGSKAGRSISEKLWLPFLNAYRTMCLAPEPDFRRVLDEVRDMRLAA